MTPLVTWLRRHCAHWVHKGEHFFHLTYLACVSYEAHGMYGQAATVLLVVTVLGIVIKD